ncbi:MAG TPA: hypothetical protein GXX72_07920 [Clostridiaceae bacterium]|nr:hypothetical protein [Clostridiaceae bacterium]
MDNKSLTVKEAAEILNMPQQLLRLGLQQDKLPFGVAVKRRRWAYYINKQRLEKWMKGEII